MIVSDIKAAFAELQAASRQLNQLILQQRPSLHLPSSDQVLDRIVNEYESQPNDHQQLAQIITDFYYQDGQDGRQTRSFHGVVNATADIADKIGHVNQHKDNFRRTIQLFRQQQGNQAPQLISELQKTLIQSTEIDRSLWGYSQLSRVHLKQVYRHIPLLADRPEKIGFSWYMNGKSIKKVSHSEAFELLLELGESKPHIRQQLAVLAQEPQATQLVQVQTLAPIMRANIRYADRRQAMNCSIPLFIPAQTGHEPLPAITDTGLKPELGRTRKTRNDDLLEPTPLLKSLRIHRLKSSTTGDNEDSFD